MGSIQRPKATASNPEQTRTGERCPICDAPTEQSVRPFCSRRCADVDLSRWLRGAYAIPVRDEDEDDDGDAHTVRQRGKHSSGDET